MANAQQLPRIGAKAIDDMGCTMGHAIDQPLFLQLKQCFADRTLAALEPIREVKFQKNRFRREDSQDDFPLKFHEDRVAPPIGAPWEPVYRAPAVTQGSGLETFNGHFG